MKDQLEDFVKRNRSAFDDKEPSDKVWQGVESAIPGKKVSLWNSVNLWRAAALVFMATSAYLFVAKSGPAKQQDIAVGDFADVEQFYFQQISEKTALIEEFKRSDGLNGFTNDFKQLEAMYMVLKEEMKNSPSQKVKDALVLNLLVRIDLLNQQLHKLENEYKPEDEEERKSSKNV